MLSKSNKKKMAVAGDLCNSLDGSVVLQDVNREMKKRDTCEIYA